MDEWATLDGCDPEPEVEQIGDDVEHRTWAGCDDTEVELYSVVDGGHTWPGSPIEIPFGTTTQTVDATELILDFFEQFTTPSG